PTRRSSDLVENNARSMADAAGRIASGEVTRAVRDATTDIGPVHEGDWIGLTRAGICSADPDLADAVIGLLADLVGDEHEIVTIIEGEGSNAATTRRITEWLAEHRPEVSPRCTTAGSRSIPICSGSNSQ